MSARARRTQPQAPRDEEPRVQDDAARRSLLGALRRHPLVGFFVLAFLFSWASWVPMALAGARVAQGSATPSHFPGLLGPALAAVVVTAAQRGWAGVRELVRRMARWPGGDAWTRATVVSPIILLLAVVVGLALFGRPWPWSDLGSVNGLPRMSPLAVWVSLTLLNGFGEETGWRGFALPLLQERYGALGGTLLLAALWGSWHAPMFFVLDTYRALGPAMLPGFFLGLAAGAVLLTWLYNRSGGSVIAVAVWHGCFNFATATRAAQGIVAAVVSTTVMVWGIALTVLDVRARRRGARSVLA